MTNKIYYIIGAIGLVLTLMYAIPNIETEEQVESIKCFSEVDTGRTLGFYGQVVEECENVIDSLHEHNTVCNGIIKSNTERVENIEETYKELKDYKPSETQGATVKEIAHEGKQETLPMRIHQDKNPLPNITGNTKQERFENFVNHYARGFGPTVFVQARQQYGVPEELLACIAYAETHIGNANKSTSNIMNYGNNDRGSTRDYNSVQSNVNSVAHGLTQGKYLSKNTILGELSQGGRIALGLPGCSEIGEYCYATSPENWRGNVYDCMTMIHGVRKDWDNFTFKKV